MCSRVHHKSGCAYHRGGAPLSCDCCFSHRPLPCFGARFSLQTDTYKLSANTSGNRVRASDGQNARFGAESRVPTHVARGPLRVRLALFHAFVQTMKRQHEILFDPPRALADHQLIVRSTTRSRNCRQVVLVLGQDVPPDGRVQRSHVGIRVLRLAIKTVPRAAHCIVCPHVEGAALLGATNGAAILRLRARTRHRLLVLVQPSGCTQLTIPVTRLYQRGEVRCLDPAWHSQSAQDSGASFKRSLENLIPHAIDEEMSLSISAILESRCSNASAKYDSAQSRRCCTISGLSEAPPTEGIWGKNTVCSSHRRTSLSISTKSVRAHKHSRFRRASCEIVGCSKGAT